MSSKKLIGLGALALMVPSLLTGCGGGGSGFKGPGFIFWHCFNKDVLAKLEVKVEKFKTIIKQQTGVDINIQLSKYGSYDLIKDKITKGITTGNVPTMAVAYPDHVANYLAKEGSSAGKYVYKLDDYFTDSEIGFGKQTYLGDDPSNPNDFFPAFLDEGTHYIREGTYSLPFMKSTEVLYYNMNLLKKFLKQYEPTQDIANSDAQIQNYMNTLEWDDFMELCEFIVENKDNISGITKGQIKKALGYDSDANFFITKMVQNNIGYAAIKEDGKGDILFDKNVSKDNFDNTVKMLKSFKKEYDKGVFLTKLTNGGKYSSDSFINQECVFTVGSSGGADYNEPKGDNFTTGVAPVPYSNETKLWVSQGVTIAFMKNDTLSKEENDSRMNYAWQFAKYLTNPVNNVDMCFISKGYYPVRESALETDAWQSLEDDPNSIRTKTMKVLTDKINGKYFNTAIFQGSAELRVEVGSLLAQVMLLDANPSESAIGDLVTKTVEKARTYFK